MEHRKAWIVDIVELLNPQKLPNSTMIMWNNKKHHVPKPLLYRLCFLAAERILTGRLNISEKFYEVEDMGRRDFRQMEWFSEQKEETR